MSSGLSFFDIAKMFKALLPPLYYATDMNIERDKMYYTKETRFTPECVICHPDDLEEVRAVICRPLVHLREWKPMMIVSDPRPLPRSGPQLSIGKEL